MERFQRHKGVALTAQFADYAKYLTEAKKQTPRQATYILLPFQQFPFVI